MLKQPKHEDRVNQSGADEDEAKDADEEEEAGLHIIFPINKTHFWSPATCVANLFVKIPIY